MLFSKSSKTVFILAFIYFIAACAPTGGKRGDDNITLLEDAEKQTTIEYAENFAAENAEGSEKADGSELEDSDAEGTVVQQDGLADDPFAVDENSYAEGALPAEGVDAADPYVTEQPEQLAGDTIANEMVEPAQVEAPKLSIEERFGPNPYLSNPPLVVEQAKIDFTEALALLKAEAESLKVDKSETKNLESKAEAVERKAPETDATTKMKAVVDNYPELSGPAYNLAYYYYQLDYDNDAIKYLDIATARNYYNVEAHNLKAKIYRDRSDFENAEKAYKEAIAAWGGYLPAYKNIGIMYDLYMGQPEKAYEYYKQYNDYNPEEDRQVIGWAVVIERKMKAQQMMAEREAKAKAAAEAQRQAEEAAANAASAAESQSEQPEQVSGQQDTAATKEPAEQNTAVDAALEAAEAEQANTEAE